MTRTPRKAPHAPTAEDEHKHHLCMPEESRKKAARRLAIARGHLESIQRQLDDPHAYCIDVLRQLSAVQGALSGAAEVVLRGHLEAHVATAALRGDESEIVEELMEALKYT
ncbi:copper homeostasis operon regulatory protein [Deinococcus aerius]|uniref:Copper-sensing transcriptional repressor CsoR n=1 Tax=Deinococcus aerius TaxID=200253 RepID=A0A2I9DMY8_9DEIO|nr:metal-sensitive transcriptional regulator [Deinococcus aerius]GBF07948.1 copper homeostasis operon regulatory protein [Deinococcus aerius]